jgi:tripeptide aminopeptidase
MPLGRIDFETTANIGIIHGGLARNVVPDRVELSGEARSREVSKLEAQTARMRAAFESAARHHDAAVQVDITRSYDGYVLKADDTMVSALAQACLAEGIEPELVPTGGGSDANIFNAHGMQVVNLSMGAHGEHTLDEHVAVADMVACARVVLRCVRGFAD